MSWTGEAPALWRARRDRPRRREESEATRPADRPFSLISVMAAAGAVHVQSAVGCARFAPCRISAGTPPCGRDRAREGAPPIPDLHDWSVFTLLLWMSGPSGCAGHQGFAVAERVRRPPPEDRSRCGRETTSHFESENAQHEVDQISIDRAAIA